MGLMGVGDRVVVIDESPGYISGEPFPWKIGEIVTVYQVSACGKHLSPVPKPYHFWSINRFRPMTGFEIIEQAARDVKVKVEEFA